MTRPPFALALVLAPLLLLDGCASHRSDRAPPEESVATAAVTSGTAWRPVDLSRPLDVEACVRLVLASAPDLAALEARLEQARAGLVAAETWPNPVFTAQVQDVGVFRDRHHLELGQQHVSYPVFSAWTRGLAEEVARANVAATGHGVANERRLVALAAGRAFYEALSEEALAAVEQEAASLALELERIAAKRVELGDASPLDLERARAEELDARRAADLASERRAVARIGLALLLGAERADDVKLVREWPALAPDERPLEALVDEALAERPDVHEALSASARAELEVALEERRALPLADVSVSLGVREGPSGNGGFAAVSVPVPLFDRNQGARRRAEARGAAALAEVERVRRRVRAEVEGALVTARRARARLETLVRPLAEARERALATGRKLFQAGELSYVDLLVIERDAISARRMLVLAERDAAVARWVLRAATRPAEP